jgi:hypothetical protein
MVKLCVINPKVGQVSNTSYHIAVLCLLLALQFFSYFITINEFLGQAIDLDVTTAAAATGASHASFDAMKALPHKSKVSIRICAGGRCSFCRRAMFFLCQLTFF